MPNALEPRAPSRIEPREGWPASTRRGFLGLAALTISGLVLSLIAQANGAPGWLFNASFLVVGLVLATYLSLVVRRDRDRERRAEALDAARAGLEQQLGQALDHVESGDLVHSRVAAQGLPTEVGRAFLGATEALGVLAEQIQSSSTEVARAAGSVNEIASELASGSSEQAASVVEITAAMEELARTASQIAENAVAQADLAERAEESGNTGAAAVEEALIGVEEVRKRIVGIAARADALGARSKEIYRVLDLITEISQETHILSLNAAIEAATAGEHGRRFTVVAEEVRRLAQRSQESVESVRSLLDEFAGSIRATVVATEEGSKEAERVLDRALSAASAIEALRGASGDSARVAREISLATQQQNAASDQVVLTLKEVSQVVQRMADGLKAFSGTSDRLNQLGLGIQMLAQTFHLDSPHSLKRMAERWAREVERRLGNWESIDRLLHGRVEERGFVELAYYLEGATGQLAMAANRAQFAGREIPEAVLRGEGFTERPWYRAAIAERRAILTAIYPSLLSEELILTAAAPVFEAGEIAGVVGFDINIDSWTKI